MMLLAFESLLIPSELWKMEVSWFPLPTADGHPHLLLAEPPKVLLGKASSWYITFNLPVSWADALTSVSRTTGLAPCSPFVATVSLHSSFHSRHHYWGKIWEIEGFGAAHVCLLFNYVPKCGVKKSPSEIRAGWKILILAGGERGS